MTRCLRYCVATMLLAAAPAALAAFHLFRIEQLYSNADGSVQFVVMHESFGANGENFWGGNMLTSTGAGGTKTFTFPANLPSSATAGRRVLIATHGFADLKLVTQREHQGIDFIMMIQSKAVIDNKDIPRSICEKIMGQQSLTA